MNSVSAHEGVSEVAAFLPRPGRAAAWLLVFVLVYFVATLLFFAGYGAYAVIIDPSITPQEIEARIDSGSLLALMPGMYLIQFICLLPLILLASRFSTQSISETLALKPVAWKSLGFWLGVLAVYQFAAFLLHSLIDVPVDEFVAQLNASRHLPVALAVVVLAPLLEEVVFRGYLFKAWRHSWLGASGTIAVTSLLFLSLHLGQYGWVILGQLFVFSIILGLAREKTGSLITPWLLHTLNNLMAAILIIYLGWVY